MTPDDAVNEFGHAVATRLRKLSWFALHWPQDEMAGFRLYHEIAAEAERQLKDLLPRERDNVLELAAATAAALDWDQYGFAGEVVAQHIRKLKHDLG
jgi:hypothetical protein